ncbi:MAG: DUF1819 family protein [Faecalicoccus sp.]|nr:DUF1819 family protein [Faecalicoccus sp.]
MNPNTPYRTITREQFLFREMRITARLMESGKSDNEIIEEIFNNNLFQYPTERMIKNISSVCLKRLHALGDSTLIDIIANDSIISAKQTCLYAMMEYYRLIQDFMSTVIAEKYRTKDFHYSRRDLNSFFTRLQEQNDEVASWSDETVKKCKSVINKILVETEYIDSNRSEQLNPVLIDPRLKMVLEERKDYTGLAAFNWLEEN